jgi:hypothetical protein
MGAGARTMFEVAHQAMGGEHEFAPSASIMRLIFLALWYMVMMVITVILLRNKELKNRNLFIGLLSLGVLVPTIYKFINH